MHFRRQINTGLSLRDEDMLINSKKYFKSIFRCLVLCLATTSIISPISAEPTVSIDDGRIIGRTRQFHDISVDEYLGIPYARPILAEHRFKKPRPVKRFEGTLTANTMPVACPQSVTKVYPFWTPGPNELPKSEDCLYLNIWTPSDAKKCKDGKAVLFWIHGGAFQQGSLRESEFNGLPLAALGNIIVVTVNYRLGPFGFLYSGTEDAPGNVGLWDMLLALRWVNQYIKDFGGDQSRITVAGQSAGAVSAGLLQLSPLAEGLFRRQAMMSKSPAAFMDDGTDIAALSQKLAKKVGCANDTYTVNEHPASVVQCLREMPFQKLSEAASQISANFQPRFGDELIPINPTLAIANGDLLCKDLFIGVAQDEGANLMAYKYSDIFGVFGEKTSFINRSTAVNIIRDTFVKYPDEVEDVVNYYLPSELSNNSDQFLHQTYTAYGDLSYICPVVYYAEKCAEQKKVFFYFWRHRSSSTQWAEWQGAPHFSDIQYVFGQPLLHPEKYRPDEVQLSKQLIDAWTNFVKNGSPDPFWPHYSRSVPVMRNLETGDTQEEEFGPHLTNCRFLGKFLGYP